jgi:hypothetical protein
LLLLNSINICTFKKKKIFMKKLFTLTALALCLSSLNSTAQIFWTENFETGAATGLEVSSYSSSVGAWSLSVTGTEGANPNRWYVSCQEAGHLAGTCGSTCAASMGLGATLHVGSDPILIGDAGASYDAGGLCPFSCPQTDRRATSPTINCTGKFNIRLKFYYILNGQGSTDDGSVYYSPDNGSTWSLLVTPPKTSTACPGSQGKWDTLGITLPSSANNNATVKIGFRWVNNDDGTGSDPSFAVDSVSLRTPVSTGPPSASMTASATTTCEDSCITVTNTSTGAVDSARWSCPGATITTSSTSPATVCFLGISGTKVIKLYLYNGGVKVDSASTTITVTPAPSPVITKTGTTYSVPAVYTAYQWYMVALPPVAISGATNATYTTTVTGSYGIVVDSAGCQGIAYYGPLGLEDLSGTDNLFWTSQTGDGSVDIHSSLAIIAPLSVSVYDATGRQVLNASWEKGYTSKRVDVAGLHSGIYIIKLSNSSTSTVLKWLKQ